MNRRDTLSKAESLVYGDRQDDYGPPHENFQRVADLWKPILGVDITPAQVTLCLLQLKVARLIQAITHEDSWVDAAGYIALGAELATEIVLDGDIDESKVECGLGHSRPHTWNKGKQEVWE